MGQPVVHFEIIGTSPVALRRYYSALFGWEFDTNGPVAAEVSESGNYGFTAGSGSSDGPGLPGGIGGGRGYQPRVLFYVGVPDVEAAVHTAESLGGARRMVPTRSPGTNLVAAHVADPEGNVVGLASIG